MILSHDLTETLMPKAARYVLAIVLALVVWAVVATLINFGLRSVIEGYRAEELAMSFSLTLQFARLGLGVIATASSAITALAVSRGVRSAAIVSGCVLLAFFVPVHVDLWDRFPVWYHLFFLLSLPLVSYAVGSAWRPRNVAV